MSEGRFDHINLIGSGEELGFLSNVEQELDVTLQAVIAKQQEVLTLWDAKKDTKSAATSQYQTAIFSFAFETLEKKIGQLRVLDLRRAVLSSDQLDTLLVKFIEFETRINKLFPSSQE